MNKTLSICIPTYNRADKLRESLEQLIPQICKDDIPIYISDNASTDRTKEVVFEIKDKYPLVFYSKNNENYGADYNISFVLTMAKSEYAWLLGDDDRIKPGSIDLVLKQLVNNNYDMLVVNGGGLDVNEFNNIKVNGRVENLKSCVIKDRNKLLVDLGWHMTWMSCLVFSSKIIKNGRFQKYLGTSLIQFATIFDYFSDKNISVCWISEGCIYSAASGLLPSWIGNTFDIWAKNWFNVVNSLPSSYSNDSKMECIKRHGINSNIFNLKGFYSLRKYGCFSIVHFKKYYEYFEYVTNVPKIVLLLITLLPVNLLIMIRDAKRAISKICKSYKL